MITVTWQVRSTENDFHIKGIAVNKDRNMHRMPCIEMGHSISKEKAAQSLAEWIIRLIEFYKNQTVQVIPETNNPEFTKMVLSLLSRNKANVRFVTARYLYNISGVDQKTLRNEISKMYEWNEYIDHIRDAFYTALEVIELQKRIASNEKGELYENY